MADLTYVAGDTAPAVTDVLTSSSGAELNLVGSSVKFQMRSETDLRYVVDSTAVVNSGVSTGAVYYNWGSTDLSAPGNYFYRWKITWPDTTVQHTDPEKTITIEPA